jgi:hypothetical protein
MTYIVEYTSFSGKSIPMMHAVFESADAANTHAVKNVTNGNYRSYALKQINEGYKILPPISDKYQSRSGLEGPFSTLSGKVVYYDPKEGKYYDPDSDIYLSYDEFQKYDNDHSGMKDERDEVKESVDALRQIVADKNAAKVNGTLVDLFTASAIMQVYDAVNDANKVKMDSMLKTKEGLLKMANFAMTKVESVNEAEKRWKQTSMSPQEAIAKYGKENVKVKKGALRNGDDMVEVFVESMNEAGGYYTQPVYDMIKQHGIEKVMHELLTSLDADVIQSFLSRANFDEGHSPHKKGTAKYKKHMAAMHAEAKGDWSKDSGWKDYEGQKKDPYGNTIKDKNLAKRMAKSAKKQSAELDETLSPEEKKLVNQMYNKDGTLTALGKRVMNHGKTNEVTEGVADEAVHMERDHEVQMARSDLYKIANYAVKLHKMLKNVSEETGIQGWMQAKITKAADYMSSVAHTLEYDMVAETLVSEPMAVEESEERPYICVHAKKGKHECHADSSYAAAQKAAKHWKLKSTAGIDAHLAVEEMTSAGGVAAVAAPMGKTKKPQQNLMAKTKALGKITKALNKKK